MYIKLFNAKVHLLKGKCPKASPQTKAPSSISLIVLAILHLGSSTYFFFSSEKTAT